MKCLELKTGFETYYKHSSGKMKSPFQKQSNCPYNQHQLQLAATTAMYRMTTHKDHSLSQSIIMRFHSNGIEVIPLESWTQQTTGLFTSIHNHLNKI